MSRQTLLEKVNRVRSVSQLLPVYAALLAIVDEICPEEPAAETAEPAVEPAVEPVAPVVAAEPVAGPVVPVSDELADEPVAPVVAVEPVAEPVELHPVLEKTDPAAGV